MKKLVLIVLLTMFLSTGCLADVTQQDGAKVGKVTSLPIPPILEDKNPDPDRADFELVVQKSTTSFFEGKYTETYGYNGNYLGPVIRVKKGQNVSITVRNLLDEDTTVHWHGLLVPGEMDGGPHQVIKAGGEWNPYFVVNQPAATLWYHSHLLDKTGEQVYKGLAGVFIIDDEVSENLDIPKDYGINDIPLIIQDRRFDKDGTLLYKTSMEDVMHGMLGDTILVNGVINPVLEVGTVKMRFRVLNGANARVYNFTLSDGSEFTQIASDGGLLEAPVEKESLVLSPGERAEIIIDFSKYSVGDVITLESPGFDIMRFVVNKKVKDTTTIPKELATIPKTPESSAVKTRAIDLMGMGMGVNINGEQMDIDRINEFVKLGDTEIWEIRNVAVMVHPFHIHGVQFQVLDRNGEKPPANEQGWKDTVLVYPGETVRVIAGFYYEGIYMYHCHILEHEDSGMMGQFEVK